MTQQTQGQRIALVTYSTRPRGGVAHTVALAEALHALGRDVLVVGLGNPDDGFFRPVNAPTHIVPAPEVSGDLETKVFANIDALEAGLSEIAKTYDILHTQDCISARAAARVRDAGADVRVVRTVHHVDDFTSQVLMDCQREAIIEPDQILVVTKVWERILAEDPGVTSHVVPNGVDINRYRHADPALAARLRASVGATERPLLLSVGGIEPRKGSDTLVEALATLVRSRQPAPVLAVVGGHSFQDHRAYRDRVLDTLQPLGLELGRDVVEVGSVPEAEMAAWYSAADMLTFPSVKEGFGLAILEAMAAGRPVVTSDLPVFHEWMTPGRDALFAPVGDATALATAIAEVLDDSQLRGRLVDAGSRLVEKYSWEASARRHLEVYAESMSVL